MRKDTIYYSIFIRTRLDVVPTDFSTLFEDAVSFGVFGTFESLTKKS